MPAGCPAAAACRLPPGRTPDAGSDAEEVRGRKGAVLGRGGVASPVIGPPRTAAAAAAPGVRRVLLLLPFGSRPRCGPGAGVGAAVEGRRRAPEVEDAVARAVALPTERVVEPAAVTGGREPDVGPAGLLPKGPAVAPRGALWAELTTGVGGAPATPRADVADATGRRGPPTPWGGSPFRAEGESPAREEEFAVSRPRGDFGASRPPAEEEQEEEELEAPLVGWARRRATERGTALLAASVLFPRLTMGAVAPLALAFWARRERAAEPAVRPGAAEPEADDVSGPPVVWDGLCRKEAGREGGCMGEEPVSPLTTSAPIGCGADWRGEADGA